MQGPREGSWLSSAMVDAFYSRLEHETVLLLAFTPFEPTNGKLVNVIRSDWDDKFKVLFDISLDKAAKLIYDRLKILKERIRNPQAHGGFEKGWRSLYFHMAGVGALPGNLTAFGESAESKLIPIDLDEYKDACGTFDDVDSLVEERFPCAARYVVTASLDVAFDAASRSEYRHAMIDDNTFTVLVERKSYDFDRHVNMDY